MQFISSLCFTPLILSWVYIFVLYECLFVCVCVCVCVVCVLLLILCLAIKLLRQYVNKRSFREKASLNKQ